MACRASVAGPRDASSAAWTRTLISFALSSSFSPGMVTPVGKVRAEIARAPSAPLDRTTLTGIVAPKPWATSMGWGGTSSVTGVARAGATTRPYSLIELVGRFVCMAKITGLAATLSIGPVVPCPRPTSLTGAAGNRASAAAESVSTPATWPAGIVPGRTVSPAGGSSTVTVIGPL